MISFSRSAFKHEKNIIFCAPDANIPIAELEMDEVPMLTALANVKKTDCVAYLEGHRAPRNTMKILKAKKCKVTVYGNPEALTSHKNVEICEHLLKCDAPEPRLLHTDMFLNINDAFQSRNGYLRILTSNKETKSQIMSVIRPEGKVCHGDAFFCWKRGYLGFSAVNLETSCPSTMIHFQCGRSSRMRDLNTMVVETPHSWGSGECDTLIIMPDVSESVGHAATFRVRHKLITIGFAPTLYLMGEQHCDE